MDSINVPQETRSSAGTRTKWLIGGFAFGLTAMYLWDPARGKYRRNLLRDQFLHWTRQTEELALRFYRDVENRLGGAYYRWSHPMNPNVDDEILLLRVRSEFGKKVSHPKAIITEVHNGVLTLSGLILSSEVRALVRCVKSVAGVKKVVNHLEVHQNPNHISSLQGAGKEYLQ